MKIQITRQELYDKVWAIPMTTLSKEYNISAGRLKKICEEHNIPIPENGYWQKLQYGKKVEKPTLPICRSGADIIEIEARNAADVIENKPIDFFINKILGDKTLILKVSDRLYKPDSIVEKTQNHLQNQTPGWHNGMYGVVYCWRGFPRIAVSQKNVLRALRILDNLIKNFRLLGHKIVLDDDGLNVVSFDNQKIEIYIREKCDAVEEMEYSFKTRKLIPNGNLSVKTGRYKEFEFSDTSKKSLEEQIPNILARIEYEFHRLREWRNEQIEIKRKEVEKRRIEEEVEERKENELNLFLDFFDSAHRWKNSLILKEYVEFVERTFPEKKEWITWAKKKLDWYDPSVESNDELLEDVDRNTLKRGKD